MYFAVNTHITMGRSEHCDGAAQLRVLALVDALLPSTHYFRTSAARYGYDVHFHVLPRTPDFVYARVAAQEEWLRRQCPMSVVLIVDVYDVFFHQPAAVMLQRFQQSATDVVWSAERLYSGQDDGDLPFWTARREDAGQAVTPFGFLNSGGFIGRAHTLASLVSEALTVRPGAHGWRNKTCGEARGRSCSDQVTMCDPILRPSASRSRSTATLPQWIFGHLLARTWNHFNVSLDYGTRLFYVASSHDWAYSRARDRILSAGPCVVHMPYIQVTSAHGHV